jgi:charged multivesicular body protein 5
MHIVLKQLQVAVQQRALRTLKQKRMYESQLTQLAQQTFNMESAALTTENLRNTMATVDAMQVANKEMRKQYGKIDIDKIEVSFVLLLPSRCH